MTLNATIAEALDLTRQLQEQLTAGDLGASAETLARRGEILAAFESLHRDASPAERASSEDAVRELATADRELQEGAGGVLAELRTRLRSQVGATPRPGTYGTPTGMACINRKA